MIALLSMAISFLVSFAPKVLDLWGRKIDHAHELKVLDLQRQATKELAGQRLEEIKVEGALAQVLAEIKGYFDDLKSARKMGDRPSGVRWIDGLNATVRPVVAYSAFGLYIAVKVATFYSVLALTDAITTAVIFGLWTAFDEAMIGSIVGFYFGGRMAAKMEGK